MDKNNECFFSAMKALTDAIARGHLLIRSSVFIKWIRKIIFLKNTAELLRIAIQGVFGEVFVIHVFVISGNQSELLRICNKLYPSFWFTQASSWIELVCKIVWQK